jgi:hypothetical protein
MAGIFAANTLTGGASGADNFTTSGAGHVDYSASLKLGAEIVDRTVQKNVVEDAAVEVEQVQNDFLRDRSQQVEAKADAEFTELEEANPKDAKVVSDLKRQLAKMDNSITTTGVSASRAQARRDAAISQAAARAPLFAKEIRAFGGSRGAAFDAETDQLIKERNDFRDGMVKSGYDPDSVTAIAEYNRLQIETSRMEQAKVNDFNDKRDGVNVISKVMLTTAAPFENEINQVLASAGGDIKAIPSDTKLQLITKLQSIQANVGNTVRKMIIDADYKMSAFSQEDIRGLEAIYTNSVDARIAQLQGTVQATAGNNSITMLENDYVLDLYKASPEVAQIAALANYFDPTSPLGGSIGAKAQRTVSKYLEITNLPQFSEDILVSQFKQQNSKDLTKTMNATAAGLANIRKSWNTISGTPDPATLLAHGTTLNSFARTLAVDPRSFTQSMVSELMTSYNSPGFRQHFDSMPDDVAMVYASNLRDGLAAFADQRIVPSIQKDVESDTYSVLDYSTAASHGGRPDVQKFSDYATIAPMADGAVGFTIKGSASLNDQQRAQAENNVRKLNAKYKAITNRIALTSARISGSGDGDSSRLEQSAIIFRKLFPDLEIELSSTTTRSP